jgi:PadR family transcriptional regulator PadR
MEQSNQSARETLGAPPRGLLEPYLLLLLRNLRMHGYQLMRSLTAMGFAAVDPASVYRVLRQMEKEGLITSCWETGDAGPAKRTYTLTDAGETFLANWAGSLQRYQGLLDRFFDLYLGASNRPSDNPRQAEERDRQADLHSQATNDKELR